jgi:hypothetical protein
VSDGQDLLGELTDVLMNRLARQGVLAAVVLLLAAPPGLSQTVTNAGIRSIEISFRWEGAGPSFQRADTRVIIGRGEAFLRDGVSVGRQSVERLVRSLVGLVPALGLYTCQDHADDYPEYDVRIVLDGGRVIKVRSTSNCPEMVPWNVTAGRKLYASYNPELARAVYELHGRNPGPAFPSRGPRPESDWTSRDEVTQQTLFRALESEMHRLLAANRPAAQVDLHTVHMVEALRWMDAPGLKAWLRALERRSSAPASVRRYAAHLLERLP